MTRKTITLKVFIIAAISPLGSAQVKWVTDLKQFTQEQH